MERVENVARKLNALFQADNQGATIDEMRLHKLLYFVQRESLLRKGEPLFEGEFEGWKYGPVLVEIRQAYRNGTLFANDNDNDELSSEAEEIVNFVYSRYKDLSPWQLSILSHGEFSWQNAREGLSQGENGSKPLDKRDMMLDAFREKIRRAPSKRSNADADFA